ncbi:MAG: ATP-dependent protease ATPase subunit HslU [Bacteroidota bacterium]
MDQQLTPVRIVQELDKYIIGQREAKKAVAVALRNRWRRMNAEESIRGEIIPNNILMIGSTGVGKTEIARRLAALAGAPFVKVEASKFTEVGYVGRDVESMIRDLVENAITLVRKEKKAAVHERAKTAAEDRILDILIPPTKGTQNFNPMNTEPGMGFNVDKASDDELNARTREKFRDKLRRGELEDREVEIEVTGPAHNVQVMGGGMEGMEGLQDMLQNMVPKKTKKRKMPIKQAREHLIEEESDKLIDQEAVQREALEKAQNSGIVFVDEIDKVVATREGTRSGADVSREGVQRDLLPIVEGSTVSTKHGVVKTDHMLFIAAGAFHISKPSEMIPELQGRFPIRVELNSLTKDDFVKILTEPRNALTKQYEALLKSEGVQLSFDEGAIDEIAEIASEVNAEVENIGARRLHTILSTLLEEILFEVPDLNSVAEFKVNRELVKERLGGITQTKDLSEYIL